MTLIDFFLVERLFLFTGDVLRTFFFAPLAELVAAAEVPVLVEVLVFFVVVFFPVEVSVFFTAIIFPKYPIYIIGKKHRDISIKICYNVIAKVN